MLIVRHFSRMTTSHHRRSLLTVNLNSLKFHQNFPLEPLSWKLKLEWEPCWLTRRHTWSDIRHFATVNLLRILCNSSSIRKVYRCVNSGCKLLLPWRILYRTCSHIYCFVAEGCWSMWDNRFRSDPCMFRKSSGTNGSVHCRHIQLKIV